MSNRQVRINRKAAKRRVKACRPLGVDIPGYEVFIGSGDYNHVLMIGVMEIATGRKIALKARLGRKWRHAEEVRERMLNHLFSNAPQFLSMD